MCIDDIPLVDVSNAVLIPCMPCRHARVWSMSQCEAKAVKGCQLTQMGLGGDMRVLLFEFGPDVDASLLPCRLDE